jgi:hypothetical protein
VRMGFFEGKNPISGSDSGQLKPELEIVRCK